MDKFNWRYFEERQDWRARFIQTGRRSLFDPLLYRPDIFWGERLLYNAYIAYGLWPQAVGVAVGSIIGEFKKKEVNG